MDVMKHLRVAALSLAGFCSTLALAQLPQGMSLVSTQQALGKPGSHISVSQNTWAIGYSFDNAPYTHGGPPGTAAEGTVRVYDWDGFNWIPKGGAIDSVLIGQHRNLSYVLITPNTLGVSRRTPFGLTVVVYDWQGSEWVARSEPIWNAQVWHMADENTVVVAQPSHPSFPATFTTVYQWDGSQWLSKGNPINPNLSHSMFGSRVFMPDENKVAIAANGFDGRRGKVYVFYWTGNQWHQRGMPIVGDAPGDRFGSDLWMPDENTIAIGATGNDGGGPNRGPIKVYDWNGQVWMQRGSDILGGIYTCHLGWGFQMPDDNTLLAKSDSTVQLYQFDGSDWQPSGWPLEPGAPSYEIWSSAMSGPYVAVGSSCSDTGMVRMFDYSGFISTPEIVHNGVKLYQNPASDRLTVEVPSPQEFLIIDASGRTVLRGAWSTGIQHIDVSRWSSGLYALHFPESGTRHPFVIR